MKKNDSLINFDYHYDCLVLSNQKTDKQYIIIPTITSFRRKHKNQLILIMYLGF